MDALLGRYSSQMYAVLRIVAGVLFMMHGSQKLFGHPPGDRDPVMLISLLGLAGVIEFGCGLLIALGLLTGYAAFLASGEMAVAYFLRHPARGFWPIQNAGELAVVYSFLFLFFAATGSGIWSVDRARRTSNR